MTFILPKKKLCILEIKICYINFFIKKKYNIQGFFSKRKKIYLKKDIYNGSFTKFMNSLLRNTCCFFIFHKKKKKSQKLEAIQSLRKSF